MMIRRPITLLLVPVMLLLRLVRLFRLQTIVLIGCCRHTIEPDHMDVIAKEVIAAINKVWFGAISLAFPAKKLLGGGGGKDLRVYIALEDLQPCCDAH